MGQEMDVKDAVNAAKQHIRDLFGEEHITNLGLEEVEFRERGNEWLITIGFTRPWDNLTSISSVLSLPPRTYKVVRISDRTGNILSVRNREAVQ